MADVIIGYKILPKTVEINLDKLEENIVKDLKPAKISREPIAFGLVAIHIVMVVPDAGGVVEEIENKLKAIEDIGEIEVTGLTRSL